ncbi:XPG domain containing-domain-containing protein [Aspergillus alliaceus]|uniref:XPG domain containing-domain-containing protein n=1 Tax=Petromyces alliaceus TaxID=209559 RepID=UPI0012A3F0AA|nr:XPG domain containing-domain-containing protein [Aspergillus alliaceus]KAB8228209.1 XPG domain containing-domain-containing protein [Aspergillus alliaceus]
MCFGGCYLGQIRDLDFPMRYRRAMKERICFDGALPSRKRETRLSRLEKSRKKLELLRSKTQSGLQRLSGPSDRCAIILGNVLRSRPLPATYNDLPDNPFIVPTVFEDLKYRWNRENILTAASDILCVHSVELEGFPWAGITEMVPGEADAYCASTAKHTSCSILTNDTDLLLYDLGPQGSVIFLDSIEIVGGNPHTPEEWQIKAMRLSPGLVAQRLGIPNILRFAFEIKSHPDAGIAELVKRANSSYEDRAHALGYQDFVQEYQDDLDSLKAGNLQFLPHFDARVSELFWQYELRQTHISLETPHVYLAILNEDHARRCAWVQGRLYRNLAYSVLNASRPASERVDSINEFVRRGGRIAVDKIDLGNENWIMSEVGVLLARLKSIQHEIGVNTTSPAYWIMFALCELDGSASNCVFSDSARLSRFLTLGHMDERFDWRDIHLTAQIQAVLYSLRILGQLLRLSMVAHGSMMELRSMLSDLPSLHVIMGPTASLMEKTLNGGASVNEFVHQSIQLLGKRSCSESADHMEPTPPLPPLAPQGYDSRVGNGKPLCGKTDNMYDILPME